MITRRAFLAIIVGSYVYKQNQKRNSLGTKLVQLNQLTLPPNQSLKLTEPAVDDLTRAKQPATIGHDSPRAD